MHRLALRLALAAIVSALSAAAAPAPAAGASGNAAPAPRPNIVLVLTDDQRWDTLAAMPTVQRELVARGVTFSNAFVVNPFCCPSRASFLTGLYSHSTKVYGNIPPYGGAASFDASSTIGTWLSAAGYQTAYIGKYLNGYFANFVPPGWHRWVGYNDGYFGYTANVDGIPVRFGFDEASYSTDVFTREAVSFLETARGPFLLVYSPFAPHAAATPAPRHDGAFADVPPWRPPSYDEEDVSDKPRWLRERPRLTPSWQGWGDEFRRRQLASLLAVDEGVGRILETLEKTGSLGNTMVVFASDNGLLWGEHRLVEKKVAAFEESIRIPLVVRYDALVSGPRTDGRLVTNIDLAPTFAALAGAKAPPVEGESLVPLLGSEAATPPVWRRSFLVEHLEASRGQAAEIPTYCAVRGVRWKYVVYSTREEELYDLATDPYERENRAADPAVRARLFAFRSEVKELCDPPPPGFRLDRLCTHEAGEAPSVLRGTRRADKVCGGPTRDVVYALAGDDVVQAGAGADEVHGGGGADRLVGGPGRDRLHGGAGDDAVLARDGERDHVACGPGRDVVTADRTDRVAPSCELVRRPVAGRPR